jgi:hypothetical protein
LRIFWKYRGAYGIQFFSLFGYTCALWYIPNNVTLGKHQHPNQHIEILLLSGGGCRFTRTKVNDPSDIKTTISRNFKSYTTPDGYYHQFTERKGPILYLNLIKWLNGVKASHPKFNFVKG